MGERQNPSILNMGHGEPIYRKWLRMRKTACVSPEFMEFRGFYDWCMESGYSYGATLQRRNKKFPFSPQNCYLVFSANKRVHANSDLELAWASGWNKTVNRIRRYYGLPLFDD